MPRPRDALDLVPGIVHKASRTLRAKVSGLIARAVVKGLVESSMMRVVQYERRVGVGEEAEHFEPYGWTSRPFADAEAVVVSVGGAADHQIVLVVADRRHRPTSLAEGEVCIHDDQGAEIRLARTKVQVIPPPGGTIEVGGAGGKAAARSGDSVGGDAAFDTWVSQVQTAINAAWPGSVTPIASMTGTITSGSATVTEID